MVFGLRLGTQCRVKGKEGKKYRNKCFEKSSRLQRAICYARKSRIWLNKRDRKSQRRKKQSRECHADLSFIPVCELTP